MLKGKGAAVFYHDPYIPVVEGIRHYTGFKMESVVLDKQCLQAQDCLVLITDHSCFDLEYIIENSKLIVDTRNAFSCITGDKLFKA